MSEMTFLGKEQYFDEDKIDIIKKKGTKAAITDFSILLGGIVFDKMHINRDSTLSGRTGLYCTVSEGDGFGEICTIMGDGTMLEFFADDRCVGARPVLPFSSINEIPTNGESGEIKKDKDEVEYVEYGYYPQMVATNQDELERAYQAKELTKSGFSYTTDSRMALDPEDTFESQDPEEYIDEKTGKRYVRVIADYDNSLTGLSRLSNGQKCKRGDPVWVEVEPIKWLVDRDAKIMLTDKIIFAGVQFAEKGTEYHTEDFEKTRIKKFMDEHFSKDIEQVRNLQKTEKTTTEPKRKRSRLEKMNPDTTKPEDRRTMTDTEMIQSWIENGESVLLRGPSGIGKTDRIRKLYPNLIELKLTNNMFPEKVVGSTNIQTGQEIPPSYAKEIIMQAATPEEREAVEENIQNIYEVADKIYERSQSSDEKQVILLDELLNVNPHVQSLVYTLVLNRFVEIGKGIKLPDNVVIVATGNQQKYSNTSYDLAEPLEKRFDHILDMEPKVGEWLTEYAIPQKIHPTVIGYIMSKYQANARSENLSNIGYFYEEPEVGEEHLDKYGQKGRTNDPRGWTSISNGLYGFERDLRDGKYEGFDVEDKLRRNLSTKLRMEWAEEFYNFYNLPTLTPEEIVQGMGKGYTQEDLPEDINERFAFMTALITADEKQVAACREFIRKYCDPEYLEVFDIYWAGEDSRRQEKIAELQMMQSIEAQRGEELSKFAELGASAYDEIGQMYKNYLQRDSKEKDRGGENDRN